MCSISTWRSSATRPARWISDVLRNPKSRIPNPKAEPELLTQIPTVHPMPGWDLEFGIWDLGFGISISPSPTKPSNRVMIGGWLASLFAATAGVIAIALTDTAEAFPTACAERAAALSPAEEQ